MVQLFQKDAMYKRCVPERVNENETLFLIPFIYVLCAIYGISHILVNYDNKYLWYAHIGFGISFTFLLFFSDLGKKIFHGFFANYGGICLFCFLFYYFIVIVTYPDLKIAEAHLYTDLLKFVLPGLMIGILSFTEINFYQSKWCLKKPIKKRTHYKKIIIIIASLVSFLFLMLTFSILANVPMHSAVLMLILPKETQTGYQSFSMYAVVATILSMNYVYLLFQNKYSSKYIYFISSLWILIICIYYGLLSSLVGSKKEVLAIILLFVFHIFYTKPKHLIFYRAYIGISGALCIILMLIVSFLFYSLWSKYNFELPTIKFFDYGEGINIGSFIERIDILTNYGIDQLLSSPILGDIGVEYKYGGAGLYIHSIISVQSHLGIVGSVTLFTYLVDRLFRLYRAKEVTIMKITVPVILFISLIATFFTWLPFWFLMGSLLTPKFLKSSKGIFSL